MYDVNFNNEFKLLPITVTVVEISGLRLIIIIVKLISSKLRFTIALPIKLHNSFQKRGDIKPQSL